MLPMKLDCLAATDVDCRPRKISANVNSRYRRGYAGSADADPLQGIDAEVLWTACRRHILPVFHYGYWPCSDFGVMLPGYLKPSTPRLNSLRFMTRTVLFSMMLGTFLFDVGAADASNTRSALFQRLSPPSLLCFDVAVSDERAIQPEKGLFGMGCYVGNGAELTGALRQLLAVCGAIDLVRWGNRNVFD